MTYVMKMTGKKKRGNSISPKNNVNEAGGCISMCIRMRNCSWRSFEESMSICHSWFETSFWMCMNSGRGTVL